MRRVFPDAGVRRAAFSHPIFHGLYDFPAGLPKIRAFGASGESLGLFRGKVVCILYADTEPWGRPGRRRVPEIPRKKREIALRMALNIVHYALTH